MNPDLGKYRAGWRSGLPETACGAGSTLEATIPQRRVLARWTELYRWHEIVDVGAGDLNWIPHIQWPHPVHYVPLDLVPRTPAVRQFDILSEIPPACDVVWCLWVLNHLPEAEARLALNNLKQTRAPYLVYTWWPMMADFLDLYPVEYVTIRPEIEAELRLVEL